MRFLLVATDYDGTIAADGAVDDETMHAMEKIRPSGRKLVLVTGRHMPDLRNVFPHLEIFDRVIAENGALLFRPSTGEEVLLGEAPPEKFLQLLTDRNVPFSAGRGIVATWEPHQDEVLRAIRDLSLDLQVIFNKGAVMVLPAGINKGSGLKAALDELGLSWHNVVSVGDAENDLAFLAKSECAVAVSNALSSVKDRADIVTNGARGEGFAELVEQLLTDDLARYDFCLNPLQLGYRDGKKDQPVMASQPRGSILVAGPSASGKSTMVSGLLEQLAENEYQFCLLDPEGDYDNFAGALTLGTSKEAPEARAIMSALNSPQNNVVVDLLGIKLDSRPEFFASLLPALQDLRSRTGRPHWIVIDETHHLLPLSWTPAAATIPQVFETTIMITVHPDHVSPAALNAVNTIVALGKSPMSVFRAFAEATHIEPPKGEDHELATGEGMVWFRGSEDAPIQFKLVKGKAERRRHVRNYAEGELSEPQSFYFRGPESKLNLRAQNLNVFAQLADGVDDDTWSYHLRRGDYSRWFADMIKDPDLAEETSVIEKDQQLSAAESRIKVKEAITKRYTAPE